MSTVTIWSVTFYRDDSDSGSTPALNEHKQRIACREQDAEGAIHQFWNWARWNYGDEGAKKIHAIRAVNVVMEAPLLVDGMHEGKP